MTYVGVVAYVSRLLEPSRSFEAVEEDPEDNKFVDVAVEAGADFILSGDSHLLELEEFRGVEILEPSEFLSRR